MTHLPAYWKPHLLAVCGAPHTEQNFRLLDAWAAAEGGEAKFNPLNTTLNIPGGLDVKRPDYNTAGVKNYRNAIIGVAATAATLANGGYRGILGALQRGELTAEQIVATHRDEFHRWGTNPDVILRVLADG